MVKGFSKISYHNVSKPCQVLDIEGFVQAELYTPGFVHFIRGIFVKIHVAGVTTGSRQRKHEYRYEQQYKCCETYSSYEKFGQLSLLFCVSLYGHECIRVFRSHAPKAPSVQTQGVTQNGLTHFLRCQNLDGREIVPQSQLLCHKAVHPRRVSIGDL